MHQATVILKHSTVVRCAKYCDKLSVSKKLVSVVDHEMTSANKVDFIFFAKFFNDLLVECERNASLVFFPLAVLSRFWITPEHIAEQSGVWHISRPFDVQNLFGQSQFWRETTVHTEDFVFNNG